MTSLTTVAPVRTRSALSSALTLSIFVAALLVSAFLLFGVQPMFGKMVLPVLGGTPAVWSLAMVSFQALLLGGYLYAHLLTRYLDPPSAGLVHLAVMACAFVLLPISVATGWEKPPASGQAVWLLGLFLASVGLPFFAIAGNGPLLQAWFASSDHPRAKSPYFLYAASNIGSFAALVSYPFLIEPYLSLKDQSHYWTLGFMGVAVLVSACARIAGRGTPTSSLAAMGQGHDIAPTWRERGVWAGLSFIPSGLLVAVTAHISTDIAAAPLLWVVPLALFLLTFVLAFRAQCPLAGARARQVQVWGTALVILTLGGSGSLSLELVLHLGVFFVNALVCHRALYEKRPSPERLTEFYLWLSLGGVLGGIFCGLLAPYIFSTIIEYPLLLLAALLAYKPLDGSWRSCVGDGGRTALACIVALAVLSLIGQVVAPTRWMAIFVVALFATPMMIAWRETWRVLPLAIAALLAGNLFQVELSAGAARSFFGVHKLKRSEDGRFRMLFHGTTLHGAMRVTNEDGTPATGRPEPTTYYAFRGAIGSAIVSVRAAQGGALSKVAAIGLGSGSLACHAQPRESWSFFEIDPVVVRIARDPNTFRFLQECAPDAPIVLGDARLTLAAQPPDNSLIVVDAFSSDAIPTHLITKEAIALYLSHLGSSGAIVFHISNRHLDLRQILARTAAEHGLVAYTILEGATEPTDRDYRTPSLVMALARQSSHLGRIAGTGGWQRLDPDMSRRPWTDDFSNLLEAILDSNWRRPQSGH